MNEEKVRPLLKALGSLPYTECDYGLFGKYVVSAKHNGCGDYFFVASIWSTRASAERFVKETLFRDRIFDFCSTISICLVELPPER